MTKYFNFSSKGEFDDTINDTDYSSAERIMHQVDNPFEYWRNKVLDVMQNKELRDALVFAVIGGDEEGEGGTLQILCNDKSMDPWLVEAIGSQIAQVFFLKICPSIARGDADGKFKNFTERLTDEERDTAIEALMSILRVTVNEAKGKALFKSDPKAAKLCDESMDRAKKKMVDQILGVDADEFIQNLRKNKDK